MTDLATHPVEDPDQLALYADEWTVTRVEFASRFKGACWFDAQRHGGWVNPNRVRRELISFYGDCYNPRQLSALWSVATARDGYLDNTEERVQITGEGSRGNGGKSVRLRRWRGWGNS
jgi:hypothetical protein